MILKASRITTASGSGRVAAHVLRGPANESIVVIQGSELEMRNAFADARAIDLGTIDTSSVDATSRDTTDRAARCRVTVHGEAV